MTRPYLIGCDPGFGGALAVIDRASHRIIDCVDMPVHHVEGEPRVDIYGVIIFADIYRGQVGGSLVELPGARTGQGLRSTARFWQGQGEVRAALLACDAGPCYEPDPALWKPAMHVGLVEREIVEQARRDFPEAGRWLTLVKHHGRAEAMLLGRWGLRMPAAVWR